MVSSLAEPVTLPSGLVLRNRLVKSALAEGLSPKDHQPNSRLEKVYGEWGTGGWGGILTGNIMVDERFCGAPGDLVIDEGAPKEKWEKYAASIKADGAPAFAQINHPGRQAPGNGGGTRSFWDKAIAPSAIPLNIGDNLIAKAARAVLFGTPKEMTTEDIQTTIRQFANTSAFLASAGFDGVELHGAHGYLIAQFLSPKSNIRKDKYGGSTANRARFAIEIVNEIRKVVPKTFTVGMKFNSADARQADSVNETLEQIQLLVDAGIDFLEISGGTYEDPQMMQSGVEHLKSTKTSAREAFFLEFAKAVRSRFPNLKLMVTGGFRTRQGMEAAIAEGACDIVGLGRPAVINPHWPKDVILNEKVSNEDAQILLSSVELPWLLRMLPIKVLGAGAETEYYARQISQLAKGLVSMAPGLSHKNAKL